MLIQYLNNILYNVFKPGFKANLIVIFLFIFYQYLMNVLYIIFKPGFKAILIIIFYLYFINT